MVAFICAQFINNKSLYTRIFDEKKNKYIPCNLFIKENSFNAYDYGRCTYLNGTKNLIHDFDTGANIHVWYNGITFSGFEGSTKYDFNGIANNNSVSIYDSEFNRYFNYALR